jgi:hypothetical protein
MLIKPVDAYRLQELAIWAVQGRHPVVTAGHDTLSVPFDVFRQIPEALLEGATVDGQPWVPAPTVVTEATPGPLPKRPRKAAPKSEE